MRSRSVDGVRGPGSAPASAWRRSAAVGALTLVTVALSEPTFWGQPGQAYGDPLGLLPTFVAYLVVVVAVLGTLERWRPSRLGGLLLAGALLGWVVEGVVVTTVYEALPFSIIWTGVAWHALVTVVGGWVLLLRLMARGWRGQRWIAVAGAAWGVWSAFMAVDSGERASVQAFVPYALTTSAALGIGLLGWLRWRSDRLVGRGAWRVSLVLLGAYAVLQWVALPWAPLVLVPLLAVTVRAGRQQPTSDRLVWLGPPPSPRQVVAGCGLLALTAMGAYAVVGTSSLATGLGLALVVVWCVGGTGWLAVVLVRSVGRRSVHRAG